MAIGLLLRRELEGALALLIVLATQFMTNPEKLLAHFLPLWSVRGVADWTMGLAGADYLRDGLAHAAITLVALLLVIGFASMLRLRIYPPHTVLKDTSDELGPLEFDRPR